MSDTLFPNFMDAVAATPLAITVGVMVTVLFALLTAHTRKRAHAFGCVGGVLVFLCGCVNAFLVFWFTGFSPEGGGPNLPATAVALGMAIACGVTPVIAAMVRVWYVEERSNDNR